MGGPEKLKGRGAKSAPTDPFQRDRYEVDDPRGVDEEFLEETPTEYIPVFPKKVVHEVDSPDIGHCYSLNPYQGCEHGCIYCYARNSHNYWGYSAGLDFERKVLVKENAADILRKQLQKPGWTPMPMMLSGNTDCYQPVERKKRITRRILETLDSFGHPVGIITKNGLVLRDIDILEGMARNDLVHVNVSLTTLQKDLGRLLEPRTATPKMRLQVIEALSSKGIPVNVMIAPVIPSLNASEIPELVEKAAEMGASSVAYTMVRLNGGLDRLFEEWLDEYYPDRKDKVLHQIEQVHGGQLNDSRFGTRLTGEGAIAQSISDLFRIARMKHFPNKKMPPLRTDLFSNGHGEQLDLFNP